MSDSSRARSWYHLQSLNGRWTTHMGTVSGLPPRKTFVRACDGLSMGIQAQEGPLSAPEIRGRGCSKCKIIDADPRLKI